MPEPGTGSRIPKTTTPDGFPIPPPQPSACTVDLGSIQHDLGKQTEAVATLKEQSKDHDTKLGKVCQDVNDAKAAGKTLRWVAIVAASVVGGHCNGIFSSLCVRRKRQIVHENLACH